MADQVTIQLQLEGIDAVEAETAMEGLDIEPETTVEDFGVLETIVLIGAAIAAGKFVIRIWKEFKGGTVVDMTKKPPDVRRDRDLDNGFFLIIAEDGTVTIEAKDEPKDAMERMVTDVLKVAAGATVDTIKAVIEKALPSAKIATGAPTG